MSALSVTHLEPADIPGLVNVYLSDGRALIDLTMGQFRDVGAREGWLKPCGLPACPGYLHGAERPCGTGDPYCGAADPVGFIGPGPLIGRIVDPLRDNE